METKDPGLTKTRIANTDTSVNADANGNSHTNTADQKNTQTLQETVIGTRYVSDDVNHGDHTHEDIHHNNYNVMSTDDEIANTATINNATTINKGTDTFQESVIDSEHVNDGDNPARQPDRRDQEGSAFDEGINEHSVGSEEPKSHEITDMNRYANIDNAQTRVLNPDEKD